MPFWTDRSGGRVTGTGRPDEVGRPDRH